MKEEQRKAMFARRNKSVTVKPMMKQMAKSGLHCPECGLWLPKSELKKGLKCPECGKWCEI